MGDDSHNDDIDDATIIDVTPEKPARRTSFVGTLALLLALASCGLSGYLYYQQMMLPQPTPTQNESTLDSSTVEDIVTEVELLISQLEDQELQTETLFEEIRTLKEAIAAQPISDEPSITTNNAPAAQASDEAITALQKELIALRTQLTEQDAAIATLKENAQNSTRIASERAPAMSNNVDALRSLIAWDKVERARKQSAAAFNRALTDLSAVLQADSELLKTIALLKKESVILFRKEALLRGFVDASDEALAIKVEGEGWWQEQANTLAKLVKIRKIDAEGSSDSALIQRAENALMDGTLSDAIAEISALSEPTAPLFDAWLEQAKAYLAAEKLYQELASAMLQRSATPSPPQE